ncbi:MAG: AsmA family protein [Elusimicrobia bacterium]|nr:AsmA family protein [Elusimicrobiota bacterium]
MKLLLKLAALLLALFVIGIIAGTLAVKKYLPPEKVRSLVVANAQKALGRDVRLGDVSLNIFRGLKLEGLEVSERPDFKAGKFASAESFSLKIQWRPLLRKKVVAERIVLSGLRVSVRKEADGRFNFSDMSGPQPKAQPAAASAAGLPIELNVRRTSVSDGRIVYTDAASSSAWTLSGINAKITDFSIERPFEAEMGLKVEGRLGERPVSATLSYDGKIDLAKQDLDKMSAEIKRLELEAFGLSVKASGSIKGASSPALDLKAEIFADHSAPAAHMETKFRIEGEDLRLETMRVKLGGSELEAGGKVAGLRSASPRLDLLLKCRSFVLEELAQLTPRTRELGLAGSGFFAVAVKGPASKPVLAGKLLFKGLGAAVSGLKLSDFTGTATFDENRIDIQNLKGKVADGKLSMALTVKDYAKSPYVDIEASLTRFDLEGFLAAKAALSGSTGTQKAVAPEPDSKPPPVSAKGKFNVAALTHSNIVANDTRLTWELSGITPDMKSLSGWAKLNVGNGKLENLGKIATQSKIVKVMVFPLMVVQRIGKIGGFQLFPDFNNVAFREIAGDYEFKNGLMTLRESRLDSDAANVKAEGTIDLSAEKLDLLVSAQVGRLAPMEVEVKGTFAAPQAKPRIGKFIAEPAKRLFQRLIQPR